MTTLAEVPSSDKPRTDSAARMILIGLNVFIVGRFVRFSESQLKAREKNIFVLVRHICGRRRSRAATAAKCGMRISTFRFRYQFRPTDHADAEWAEVLGSE